MSGQSSSPPLLCASAANASLSPHPQHYTRLAAHLSLIPPHLRGAMAAYSALGQVGGSAHGQHHKIHHAGLAGCSAGGNGNDGPSSASSTSLGPNDACQETKSLTLDWKVSDLKTIFDSSRGDAKSRCIKSPLFGDGKWEIYFYGNSGSDYVSLYLSAEPTAEERERGIKFAARSRSYTAAMLAKSASNPALAAAAQAAAANKHSHHYQQQLQQHHQQLANQQQQSSSSSSSSAANNSGQPSTPNHSIPWIREGSFRFTFEIKSINKKEGPIKLMEASDHVFSSEAKNWGWQSFARRSDVYYNNMVVRHSDSFIISCTITNTPSRPTLPHNNPTLQKRLMPLELVNAFAGMFDDPAYSDVKFVITSRSPTSGKKKERSLYAIRKILASRAEYFDMMFSSGFSEAKNMTNSDGQSMSRRSSMRLKNNSAVENEDSDMESVDSDDLMVMYDSASEGEEGGMLDEDDATAEEVEESSNVQESTRIDKDVEDGLTASEDDDDDNGDAENHTAHTTINEDPEENASMTGGIAMGSSLKPAKDSDDMKIDIPAVAASSLPNSPSRRYPTRHSFRESQGDAAVEHAGTSTMRSVSTNMHITTAAAQDTSPRSQRYQKRAETRKEGKDFHQEKKRDSREGCNKECVTVVVRDASYSTYRALLYFLYTDTITFAPLSSIYAHAKDTAEAHDRPVGVSAFTESSSGHVKVDIHYRSNQFSYKTRKQFFEAYTAAVYGHTSSTHNSKPKDLICSAKSIYKIADKLNIPELKNRAFEHIVQSLTIETIPYEVFSAFSDQFPEVRKVQLDMMLHYWNEIREGQAMKNILRLIRLEPERFPGYEEVWQHLLLNLEYRATSHGGGTNISPTKESAL